jgi:hypothetical protein
MQTKTRIVTALCRNIFRPFTTRRNCWDSLGLVSLMHYYSVPDQCVLSVFPWTMRLLDDVSLEAELLDKIKTKVLRVFLLAIHSHLCLEISISSNSRNLLQFLEFLTVHWKGENRKTWWKTMPPSPSFKKSIQKSHVWELSRLCPETLTKLYIHEFGFWTMCPRMTCTLKIVCNEKRGRSGSKLQLEYSFWPWRSMSI